MSGLFDGHDPNIPSGDALRLNTIRSELFRIAGSRQAFQQDTLDLVRLAIDEVIDTARSGRFRFDELDSTEKAYIGVRVEILFRSKFSLERGKLDVVIAGEEVDIKNTTSGTWMIPTHSVDKPCLLIRSKLKTDPGTCSVGLAIARKEYLNAGQNQDRKRTFQSRHSDKIVWLFNEEPFKKNVLDGLSDGDRRAVLIEGSAARRLATLFKLIQRQPVPRHVVEAIARQQDPMKRLRRNGGARDYTEPEGIFILSFDQHRRWIEQLGLDGCTRGDIISLTPRTSAEELVIEQYLAERRSGADDSD